MENGIMRVGIIGAGWIAEKLALTMQQMTDCKLYAIAARELSRAEAFRNQWGAAVAYGSYEELVCDPNVDLVYIATPHSHHYRHTRLALEHGKPCLVEKAFTANARQAEELIRLARERKLLLAEAIWTRYQPMLPIMRRTIASGIIGPVTQITAGLTYMMRNKERIVRPDLCGGAMLDLGVYPINFLRMLLPIEHERVEWHAWLGPTGMDMNDSMTFFYPDGTMACLTCGCLAIGDNRGIVRGEKGWMEIDNCNNPQLMRVYNADRQLVEEIRYPHQITGYEYEIIACRDALLKGLTECPEMPLDETLRVMQIMDEFRAAVGVHYPYDEK